MSTVCEPQTRLLDLPDGPLMSILLRLGGPAPDRTRAVKNGRAVFAIATTCTRLYRLVCTVLALDTVDALSPSCYERRHRHGHEGLSPAQLRAVTCLAGHHLRVLRLPEGCGCPQLVLDGLTQRCPRLRELSFPDSGCLGEDVERALFANACYMTSVHIFDPRSVLRWLAACSHLRELVLTGVRPQCVDLLTELLKTSGSWLYLLQVGFDAKKELLEDALDDAPEDVALEQPSVWCVTRLANYLCGRLQRDLPALITLDVASSLTPAMEHQPHPEHSNVVETIIDVASRVSAARERNMEAPRTPGLRTIAIRTTEGNAIQCTNPFAPLMAKHVDVEIQFPGTVVVFPSQGGADALYFKALQVTSSFLQNYPSLWSSELRKLETMDIGTGRMAEAYCIDHSVSDKVGRLVKKAGTRLHTLRVAFAPKSLDQVWETCRYVADVLQAAPCVTTVQIPAAVIQNGSEGNPEYRRMMTSLRYVHVLRLKTHQQSSEQLLPSNSSLGLVMGLPAFLDLLSFSCQKLQTVLLEKCDYLWCYSRHWEVAAAARVVADAVDRFEARHPYIDIGSLQALVRVLDGNG